MKIADTNVEQLIIIIIHDMAIIGCTHRAGLVCIGGPRAYRSFPWLRGQITTLPKALQHGYVVSS